MAHSPTESETIRITVTISAELLRRSQPFIGRDALFSGRNAFVTAALERFLNKLERQEIDHQFEAMADDIDYQKLNEQLVEEFASSDWETLS